MSGPYKVQLHYGWDADLPLFSISRAMQLCDRARDWLKEHDRLDHLLNAYDNEECGITFVFSDRDTALLFRLSH